MKNGWKTRMSKFFVHGILKTVVKVADYSVLVREVPWIESDDYRMRFETSCKKVKDRALAFTPAPVQAKNERIWKRERRNLAIQSFHELNTPQKVFSVSVDRLVRIWPVCFSGHRNRTLALTDA